jgi:hypothetical protein
MNQPTTAPDIASAATTSASTLAMANPPQMLGDFFSGVPSRPVNLQSPSVSGNVIGFVVDASKPGGTVTLTPAGNPSDPAVANVQLATFFVNGPHGSLPTTFGLPSPGVNLLTVAQSQFVPAAAAFTQSTLNGAANTSNFGPPNPAYNNTQLPFVPNEGHYPSQATPGTVVNVIVQPNQLTSLQNIVTQVNATPQAVTVGFNKDVAGPTAEGYTSFPQPPGTSSGILYSTKAGDLAVSLPVNFTHVFTVDLPFAATAGSFKLGDNESPLPRDRIIFDYSFFDNTTLAPGGINVNRFTAGFEKTLFTDRLSIEFRIPFATTFDSNITIDANDGNTALTNQHAIELGNSLFLTKALLSRTETTATSAGLGVGLPTASDITVNRSDGENLYRIENTAPHLIPFVGGVWTPTERLFIQHMAQFDFDITGNEVVVNQDPNKQFSEDGTFKDAGRLKDPVFAFYDLSVGYWLWHLPPCSNQCITGLAGMLELHYNQTLGGFNSVSAKMLDSTGEQQSFWNPSAAGGSLEPLALQVGGGGAFSSLDLTAGVTMEIRDDAYLSLGCCVPTFGGVGHEFDYEIRANFSYYFGRSTKNYRTGVGSAPSTL